MITSKLDLKKNNDLIICGSVYLGMLETCTYEDMMVTLVKRITESDVHDILKNHVKSLKQGFSTKNKACPLCHLPIVSEGTQSKTGLVLFQ